ncbi:MAG: hypothetical protein ABEJ99_02475 [Candidatus Nanohaloarchaea archaeon]
MSKHQKRLSAPKHYPIQRKQNTYVSGIKGSRSTQNAIPAVLVLRDVLEYAENEKEAKQIVRQGDLLRNGEPVKDIKEGVGILDLIEIPKTEETFRVVRSGKYLDFIPVEDTKVAAKIVGKSAEGDEFVYRLHNGENYRSGDSYSVGNTLVFDDGTVSEVALEEGAEALVISGKHSGELAEIEEIHERGMNEDTAQVESEYEFETQLKNLVALEEVQVK